jgi:hypothetical protein
VGSQYIRNSLNSNPTAQTEQQYDRYGIYNTGGLSNVSLVGSNTITSSLGYQTQITPTQIYNNSSGLTITNAANNMTLNSVGGIVNANAQQLLVATTTGGGAGNPLLKLQNTGVAGSVAVETYRNSATAGVAGDVVYNHSIFGKNSGNIKEEYARITSSIRNPAATPTGADGDLVLNVAYNDVITPMLTLNGSNGVILGATNTATNLPTTINTGNNVAGSGAGLLLNGNTLTNASAGGSAGQHLCLTINGVVYKIALLNA